MPSLRSLLRSTSARQVYHPMRIAHDDDCSDDGLLHKPAFPSLDKQKLSMSTHSETSCNSISSFGEDELIRSPPVPAETKQSMKSYLNINPVSPVPTTVPNKQRLGDFLDKSRAQASISTCLVTTRDNRGRASKGRSRRISSARSLSALPTASAKALPASPIPRSPTTTTTKSSVLARPESGRRCIGSAPMSAPSLRKGKVNLGSLPRAPLEQGGPATHGQLKRKQQQQYRKTKSTLDLLREYNTILDEYGDSTRQPGSRTQDLLEEYDEILTQYDDSARANRCTPYSTGWR